MKTLTTISRERQRGWHGQAGRRFVGYVNNDGCQYHGQDDERYGRETLLERRGCCQQHWCYARDEHHTTRRRYAAVNIRALLRLLLWRRIVGLVIIDNRSYA